VGRQDVPPEGLTPSDPGVTVLGASSDHMLLDVEEMERSPRWGDVLRFSLSYSALLGLMTSPYVSKNFVSDDGPAGPECAGKNKSRTIAVAP
jgi:predicted amino acid racemase